MSQPPVFMSKADIARRHIEGLILSRAVKPGDSITTREVSEASYGPARLKDIDANIAASAEAVAAQDIQSYTRLNHEFHILLYDTPHSQWCLRMLVNLSAMTSVQFGFTVMPQRMAESLREHQSIRDAIRTGAFAEAAALIKDHEQAAYEALAGKLAAEQPPRAESAA